ncbi:CRISPR-associated endoribonuclease Cas6 [Negadavirga shengliensis]|uniref:CRISPR-associated endoribonuclease n=1 Tax=Negadavirga shengliensis TaxID=1389218 RepID=A0ABV9T0W9_9BACT
MRFRIHLTRQGKGSFLPINYQYELSSAIYKIIDRADSAFSGFLHREGYLAFGKRFRLFTFSRIGFNGYRVVRDAGRIEHFGGGASFEIGFLMDRAAEEFVRGIFIDQQLELGDRISRVSYRVSHIEATAPPLFRETMRYRCLSPVFVRRKRPDGGEDYLHPGDEAYAELVFRNLVSKAGALAGMGEDGLTMDTDAFQMVPRGKIYKNGVRIKQHTPGESQLVGYLYEFELTAPVELHEIGYHAGFGHLNSQGFGCVGVREFEDS